MPVQEQLSLDQASAEQHNQGKADASLEGVKDSILEMLWATRHLDGP